MFNIGEKKVLIYICKSPVVLSVRYCKSTSNVCVFFNKVLGPCLGT